MEGGLEIAWVLSQGKDSRGSSFTHENIHKHMYAYFYSQVLYKTLLPNVFFIWVTAHLICDIYPAFIILKLIKSFKA